MPDLTIPTGSVEYVNAPVTASVELDAQTVAISIDGRSTWLTAQWVGDAGTTRTARTSDPVTFSTSGVRHVYVKLTDTPEVPIMHAGKITVR